MFRPGIDRPFSWGVVAPTGYRWKRTFRSEDAAWRSVTGIASASVFRQDHFQGAKSKRAAEGYRVVPVSWVVGEAKVEAPNAAA